MRPMVVRAVTESAEIAARLNGLLADCGQEELESGTALRFAEYLVLLERWNTRTNLTAIRDVSGILSRHFVESIACARALPAEVVTLLDFGSGAGFPGIPIALCEPRIAVTLAESQGKKAAFLREAVRTLGLVATVHSGRAQSISERFDCVTLRAVDRMADSLPAACSLLAPEGWLALMTTERELHRSGITVHADIRWRAPMPLFGSSQQCLVLGQKRLA